MVSNQASLFLDFMPATVLGQHRGFGSKLRRKLKKAVQKATQSLMRAVKALIKPVKKVVDAVIGVVKKILSIITNILKFLVRLPKALMSLPRLGQLARLTANYVRDILKLVRLVFIHGWNFITGVVRIFTNWLIDGIPESAWRTIDNLFGSPVVWVPVCAGATGVAPQIFEPVLRPLTANYSKTGFNPFNMASVVGHWHSFRFTTYTYRILVPWVSGFVSLLIVSPLWLARLVISLPKLGADILKHLINTIVIFAEEVIFEAGKLTLDYVVAMTREALRPITAVIQLLKDTF